MNIGIPDKFEVTVGSLRAAVRGLFGVKLTTSQADADLPVRRIVANVLRSEGATHPQLRELMGCCVRHLIAAPPPVGTPVWACWRRGLPDDSEAEQMGDKLRALLRKPALSPASVMDNELAEMADRIEHLRRLLRQNWTLTA